MRPSSVSTRGVTGPGHLPSQFSATLKHPAGILKGAGVGVRVPEYTGRINTAKHLERVQDAIAALPRAFEAVPDPSP